MSNDRLIIAGAGQAGYWVASTVRQHQPDREIVLIGEEDFPPYERPPLSKAILTGAADPDSALFKPFDFFVANRIDLRLGTRVSSIDRKSCTVGLSDGTHEPYGVLVLATGLSPRTLPVAGSDHPCVVTLRGLGDVEAIRSALGRRRHLVAIGAGFIGLEVAAAAVSKGAAVTVVEVQPNALGRAVAPEVATAIVARHQTAGVAFRFGETVTEIADGDGKAIVQLGSGDQLVADLVLVGIGGVPNEALARDAGLECDDGILVDRDGATSDPHIFAAGDVTRQYRPPLDRAVRLESWQNAQNQAIAVGSHIAGAAAADQDVPWFWTDQYDDNFQMIGVPERWDQIVWRGAPDDDKFTAIYLRDDVVVGGNTLNNARDIRPLKRFIADRTPVTAEFLSDMSTSLIKKQKNAGQQ